MIFTIQIPWKNIIQISSYRSIVEFSQQKLTRVCSIKLIFPDDKNSEHRQNPDDKNPMIRNSLRLLRNFQSFLGPSSRMIQPNINDFADEELSANILGYKPTTDKLNGPVSPYRPVNEMVLMQNPTMV